MDKSRIEWTEATWNPTTGCSKISPGCANCYAIRDALRLSENPNQKVRTPYAGTVKIDPPNWTGRLNTVPERLAQPLKWTRPRRIFVNSMSDLFHEQVPDEFLDKVFAVMAMAKQHTFQVLTKRSARMKAYLEEVNFERDMNRWAVTACEVLGTAWGEDILGEPDWPLPNVWLGVSAEDQERADERIPLLLETPAAIRWVSYEPALGPVDFEEWLTERGSISCNRGVDHDEGRCGCLAGLDWIVVGGESGPNARRFELEWARDTVGQCKKAGVAGFVKQLGSKATDERNGIAGRDLDVHPDAIDLVSRRLRDSKGGDWDEWTEDLRVRQYPS